VFSPVDDKSTARIRNAVAGSSKRHPGEDSATKWNGLARRLDSLRDNVPRAGAAAITTRATLRAVSAPRDKVG
jgi:hypothetical protein